MLTCRSSEAGPPSPAGPEGYGGLLPRPAPPSCSVECHRASRGRHVAAVSFQASPWPLLAPGAALEQAASIPLLLIVFLLLLRRFLQRPRARRSAPPWKPVATFLLSHCHLVQNTRRRRLHRRVQAIEARSPEHVVLFTEPPLNPQELVVDSAAATAPPASSSPSLQPG